MFSRTLLVICLLSALELTFAEEEELIYILDETKIEKEADDLLKIDIKFNREGDEVLINGQVDQLIDIDNDWKVVMEVLHTKDKSEEYKKVFTSPQRGVCDLMQSIYKKHFYEKLKNYTNAPDPDTCPVVKSTYNVKDYPLDISTYKKFLKEGFYRFSAVLYNGDEEKFHFVALGHTEKKN